MKREPTISMNRTGFSFSRCIPDQLGEILQFDVDKENKQIIISKNRGGQMVIINYPGTVPNVRSHTLIKWIRKELGDLNYSKMPLTWDGEKFIATPGVKE